MSATAALPKPRGPWLTILLSGMLACAIAVALQPLFVLALVQTRSHTDLAAVRGHLRAAFDQGVLAESERPRLALHRGGHQFTECIGHVVLLDRQSDAMRTAVFPLIHDEYRSRSPCEELHKLVNGASPAAVTDYARYWHGYRVYLWPLLEHFSLATVRLINAILILSTVVACYLGLRAIIGTTAAAVFTVVLLSLTDLWLAWRISTHAVSLAFILLGVAGFALLYDRWRNPYLAVAVAALCGAVFNFLDILVNPPMMPMLFAFIVLAAQPRPHDATPQPLGAGWLAALVAVSWFGAYALTWGTKWALATWASPTPDATWGETLAQIIARLHGHEIGHPPILSIPLLPTVRMFGKAFISFGVVVVIVLAIAVYRHVRDNRTTFDRRRFLILVAPVLIPIVWFELLSNHTQTHMQFTYRSASAAIAIMFAAALLASGQPTTLPHLLAGRRRLRRSNDAR